MTRKIDNILFYLKKSEPSSDCLKHLEGDVWARITVEKSEQPDGILEVLVATLFPAQHRFAPVMIAAVFGVLLGFSTMPPRTPDAVEMLNFKVFKPGTYITPRL